jgi:phospholipid transport system substrate-binding protein
MGRLLRAGVLLAFVLPASAQDGGPDALVHRIAQEGIARHVDFDEATRLAAGGAWSQATTEQKKRLVEEFRQLLVRLYANAVALYPGRTLKVLATRGPAGEAQAVRAQLAGAPGQAVPIDFYVRNGKVYDISVDGVSLVRAYRADFDAAVKQGGIDGLIGRLAEKNRPPKPGRI